MALAALEHTLRLYFDDEMARRHIPILSMALVEPEELKRRTELFADKLKTHGIQATVEPSSMVMGGGTAPELYLDSWACVIDPALQEGALSPSVIDANLRASSRPVICRLVQDRLFFDLRTVRCDEEDLLIDNLMHAMKTECQS
jgi:L-seryl-tRNA(Ser) seleniumtransferase